jgi:hypothetical protein
MLLEQVGFSAITPPWPLLGSVLAACVFKLLATSPWLLAL